MWPRTTKSIQFWRASTVWSATFYVVPNLNLPRHSWFRLKLWFRPSWSGTSTCLGIRSSSTGKFLGNRIHILFWSKLRAQKLLMIWCIFCFYLVRLDINWRKDSLTWQSIRDDIVDHLSLAIYDCALALWPVVEDAISGKSGKASKKSICAPFVLFFTSAFAGDFNERVKVDIIVFESSQLYEFLICFH